MEIMISETDHDPVTRQVHLARRKVFAGLGASKEHHLFGVRANAGDFKLASGPGHRWTLFSGLGHGDANEFCGYHDTTMVDTGDTAVTMRCFTEKIVHFYSCNTAKQLGPELVKRGARAFVGYEDFVVLASTLHLEEQFVSISAAIDRSILRGDSQHKTQSEAQAQYARVRGALTAPSSTATPADVAALDSNYSALIGPWKSSQYGKF